MKLEGYRQGGELIPSSDGTVYASGSVVELELSSDLSSDAREAVMGDLYENGVKIGAAAPAFLVPGGLRLAVPLPDPQWGGSALELRVGSAVFPISLRNQPPAIETIEIGNVLRADKLYFTAIVRVSGEGALTVDAMAGAGGDPTLAQYQWRSWAAGSGVLQFEAAIENPRDEDFVYLAASASDAWGAASAKRFVLPFPKFVTMSQPPSRLGYDHSTQEMVNTLPLWTAARSRDYLALAFDPHYTMMSEDWQYLGELKDYFVPYDFAFAPVAQRLLDGIAGQQIGGLREQIRVLERGRFVSTADTGQADHLWRAELPEDAPAEPLVIAASPQTVLSLWDWDGSWVASGDEIRTVGSAHALCPDPVGPLRLRAEIRVETTLGSFTPEAYSAEQNLASLKGAGAFGLTWRVSSSNSMRLGWGWYGNFFGLYVTRTAGGATTLLYRDEQPRFYARGQRVTLEVADSADGISIYCGGSLVIILAAIDGDSGVAGIWTESGDAWRAFFSALHLEGVPGTRLIATSRLYGEAIELKEVSTDADFFEAAPTHVKLGPAAQPLSGMRWGNEPDPTRVLIAADKSGRRAVWRCDGNQICLCEERVGEPLLRFWIWLDGRAATEYTLLSVVAIRRWLYVLGQQGGAVKLFIVDPATPAPLRPESGLWCESSFDLPLRGASALARSIDRTEVFVQ